MRDIALVVQDMQCSRCCELIKIVLMGLDGVDRDTVHVDLETQTVTLKAQDWVTDAHLVRAIKKAGYTATVTF